MKEKVLFTCSVLAAGLLLILVYVYFGNTKIGYDGDELFSYMSSNMEGGYKKMLQYQDHEWQNTEMFDTALKAKEGHRFQYGMVAQNQADDTHPPVYYFLLHTVCSFFPGQFSMWFGIGLNMILMLLTLIVFYIAVNHFLENRWISLALSLCFGMTYGAINLVLFIRMYTLLLLIHTLFFYFAIRMWETAVREKGRIGVKWFAAQVLLIWGGTMTQYYFLIYFFFVSLLLCMGFCWKKYWKLFWQYIGASAVSGILCCVFYPIMLKHIFGGYRGKESAYKLVKGQGFTEDLRSMWEILSRQLFQRHLTVLCLVLLLITAVLLYVKRMEWKTVRGLLLCFLPNLLFFVTITRIAPYMIDRYIAPIYAVVYLLLAVWIIAVVRALLPERREKPGKWIGIALIAVLSVHRMGAVEQSRYWYQERYDALESAAEGIDACIYVSGDSYNWKMWGKFLEFQRYDRLYFIDGTKWNPVFIEDEPDKVVLYIDKVIPEDTWKEQLELYSDYRHFEMIYSEDYLDVYLAGKE